MSEGFRAAGQPLCDPEPRRRAGRHGAQRSGLLDHGLRRAPVRRARKHHQRRRTGRRWVALRVSATPPDARHPFGHHKAEYFSPFSKGRSSSWPPSPFSARPSFISSSPGDCGAGARHRHQRLRVGDQRRMGLRLIRIGQREKSPALDADGRHVLSRRRFIDRRRCGPDSGGFNRIAPTRRDRRRLCRRHILFAGWGLVKKSVGGLMDKAANPATLAAIKASIANGGRGPSRLTTCQTRPAGPVTLVQIPSRRAGDHDRREGARYLRPDRKRDPEDSGGPHHHPRRAGEQGQHRRSHALGEPF